MKWGPKHQTVHKAWLELHPEFDPVAVYKTLCKMLKLGEEAAERGIGKLFTDGKIKSKQPKAKGAKRSKRPAIDDFR